MKFFHETAAERQTLVSIKTESYTNFFLNIGGSSGLAAGTATQWSRVRTSLELFKVCSFLAIQIMNSDYECVLDLRGTKII